MCQKSYLAGMEHDKWIPISKRPPKEDGRYFVTRKFAATDTRIVDIVHYAKYLGKVDRFDFYDKNGEPGWYEYDSEYGHCLVTDVIAWTELLPVYKENEEAKNNM